MLLVIDLTCRIVDGRAVASLLLMTLLYSSFYRALTQQLESCAEHTPERYCVLFCLVPLTAVTIPLRIFQDRCVFFLLSSRAPTSQGEDSLIQPISLQTTTLAEPVDQTQ
ncbi:uncharacterized protein BJX67DRAFT_18849 [Aspergillus lucknowensis]|uniref:Uncharacterized protein n=1 Tax=Aspergillus lucknowensis TaxID=176173 RepID=A0ABR4M897_9EURO